MPEEMDSFTSDNVYKNKNGHYVWDGTFNKSVTKVHRVSLCITCMNRLSDLKFTLLKNLTDNLDYSDSEFILLDYNSSDGLEDWVRSNMMGHVESGKLVFLRTDEPSHYSLAHSKNVAFLAASGDIVHNLDTDNLTGPGFCSHLNLLANQVPSKAFFAKTAHYSIRLRGKVGFYKDEFIHLLGGYDEDFSAYSPDDRDIWWRAISIPLAVLWYPSDNFTKRLFSEAGYSHPDPFKNYSTDGEEASRANYYKMQRRMREKIAEGVLKANAGRKWGSAKLTKNFNEKLTVGMRV